jgi:hypothetical protein
VLVKTGHPRIHDAPKHQLDPTMPQPWGEQYCAMRRWHRELRTRDVLATPAAHAADQELKACAAKLED